MKSSLLKAAIFTLVVVGIFVYIGEVITKISGEGGKRTSAAGINPEAGEEIFWGRGKCHTCHSIADQGSAIRCPNLGEGKWPIIGVRAAERAQERSSKTGKTYTPTDYFVESLTDPGAYVVEGYKNEMPVIYKPPIALKPDDIKAVISYLQSLGGQVDVTAIKLPDAVMKASAEAETVAWKPYTKGDPEKGKELFFDLQSPAGCAKCHTVGDQGGKVGPELTNVAGTRTPQYIVQSVLDPSAEIASGFEPYAVMTNDGTIISGVKKEETKDKIVLADQQGQFYEIPKSDIARMKEQGVSIMPSNFGEILTIEQFDNVLAYLLTLQ